MKTKIKVADLGKLNFPFQRKEMIRLLGEMRNPTVPGGDSLETAVPFYIKMNHQFACKTEHPLIVLAAKAPEWKKEAKVAFKENKKGMLLGTCYVKGSTLVLIVEKGAIKLPELKKATKALLKKLGLTAIEFSKGAKTPQAKEESSPKAKATPQQSNPDAKGTDAKLEARKKKGRVATNKMLAYLKAVAEKYGI